MLSIAATIDVIQLDQVFQQQFVVSSFNHKLNFLLHPKGSINSNTK
ncbi:hypothetical protein [Desulfopila sp. IMCC35008]|nr:hypothetical protein [Desulfopila sp. IMCC35008]